MLLSLKVLKLDAALTALGFDNEVSGFGDILIEENISWQNSDSHLSAGNFY